MKSGDDSGWILVDHREQRAGWRFWGAASAFPMLDGIQTEAERLGKAGLRHVERKSFKVHVPDEVDARTGSRPQKISKPN